MNEKIIGEKLFVCNVVIDNNVRVIDVIKCICFEFFVYVLGDVVKGLDIVN